MLDKETFRKTEEKLRNYYKKDRVLKGMERRIKLLNEQIDILDYKLRNNIIKIPLESKSPSFEERVQTSSTGESYAEKTMLRIAGKMEDEISSKREEVAELEIAILNIKADNDTIDDNLKILAPEYQKFLELIYGKERKKEWQVGMILGIDQSTVNRTKQRLIEDVASWEFNWEINKKNVH